MEYLNNFNIFNEVIISNNNYSEISEEIEETEIDEPNEGNVFEDQDMYNTLENRKSFKEDFEKWNKELFIFQCIVAIDNKNLDQLKCLNKNSTKNKIGNIISEIYKLNMLIPKRLVFIFEECNKIINIPSSLIRIFLQNEETDLLNVIFKYSNFFDNECILDFCHLYKYQKAISTPELQDIISKYKIEIDYDGNYLRRACETGREHIIKYLVEHGANINRNGPLEFACRTKKVNLIKYLLEHGASVNKNGPLVAACENGDKNLIQYLINNSKADINQVNGNGDTPLIAACKNGNEELVKYLVGLGADVNKNGPLVYACKIGNENIIKYLIKHKSYVNQRNKNGDTPLISACNLLRQSYEEQQLSNSNNSSNNFEDDANKVNKAKSEKKEAIKRSESIVKYLVKHSADVNQEDKFGNTPLTIICKNEGLENIVKYLVEHGAILNKVNISKYENKVEYTPLIIACEHGYENLVKYFVERGANVNQILRYSKSPLRAACEIGNEKIVKYLVEHGAYVNIYGPLLSACYQGNEPLVKYLVEHGADVNCKKKYMRNSSYDTPLIAACGKGNESLVKYLVKHGADVNQENFYNDTPLKVACENGNEKIINFLKKHGAGKNVLIGKLHKFKNSIGLSK